MHEFGINDPAQQAMFIAQTSVETGGFRTYTEVGSDEHCDQIYYHRLGNTEEHDGSRYRGRGALQITGRDTYRSYGQRLGLDLEALPELAAQESNALRVSACYWGTKRIAARSYFESHQPA
jgi:predicted chitinase